MIRMEDAAQLLPKELNRLFDDYGRYEKRASESEASRRTILLRLFKRQNFLSSLSALVLQNYASPIRVLYTDDVYRVPRLSDPAAEAFLGLCITKDLAEQLNAQSNHPAQTDGDAQ